jgi:hypothetical protein
MQRSHSVKRQPRHIQNNGRFTALALLLSFSDDAFYDFYVGGHSDEMLCTYGLFEPDERRRYLIMGDNDKINDAISKEHTSIARAGGGHVQRVYIRGVIQRRRKKR